MFSITKNLWSKQSKYVSKSNVAISCHERFIVATLSTRRLHKYEFYCLCAFRRILCLFDFLFYFLFFLFNCSLKSPSKLLCGRKELYIFWPFGKVLCCSPSLLQDSIPCRIPNSKYVYLSTYVYFHLNVFNINNVRIFQMLIYIG